MPGAGYSIVGYIIARARSSVNRPPAKLQQRPQNFAGAVVGDFVWNKNFTGAEW
jgi:hypothetical protein